MCIHYSIKRVKIVCLVLVLAGGKGQDVFKVAGEVCKDIERCAAEIAHTVGRR